MPRSAMLRGIFSERALYQAQTGLPEKEVFPHIIKRGRATYEEGRLDVRGGQLGPNELDFVMTPSHEYADVQDRIDAPQDFLYLLEGLAAEILHP